VKSYLITKLLVELIGIGGIVTPSMAQNNLNYSTEKTQLTANNLSGLPGQTVKQVIAWSRSHKFLPPLQAVQKLEDHYPDYQSIIKLGQKLGQSASYISFEVFVNSNKIVESQTVDYRDYSRMRPSLSFTQKDSEGLKLIQKIYSEQIKKDFIRAKQVESRKSNLSNNFKINIYQGKLFIYQTFNDTNSSQFSIFRPEALNRLLKN
jgi:hypothetical protein